MIESPGRQKCVVSFAFREGFTKDARCVPHFSEGRILQLYAGHMLVDKVYFLNLLPRTISTNFDALAEI